MPDGVATTRRRIPWANPSLSGNEARYVQEAIASTWISGGAFVDRLESDFARFTGARHAIAVANGTAALHLAYLAVGIGPGDEVILPALTFAACAAMVVVCGATPKFVDSDLDTLGMSAAATQAAIGPRTKAIVPAHLFGNVCDLAPLLAMADDAGAVVIEDAAEAVGARYDGRSAGTLGALGCFSFQAAKTLTMGEGGIVVTDDDGLAGRIRLLRNHGFRPGTHYWHDVVGFNYRLTNVQAAIGCAQLERADAILAERKRIERRYRDRLGPIPGVRIPETPARGTLALWVQAVVLDQRHFPQGRDAVREALGTNGVETRPLFNPIYKLPPYEQFPAACPVAESVATWGLSLPVYETLSDTDVDFVCDQLVALAR